jgi:hypothetical protein
MAINLIQGKQIATASWAQNAVSASYSATASYALNAGGTTIDTGSFATTGSNIFIGNQTVTGSVTATQGFISNWGTSGNKTALFGTDYPFGVNNRQILFNDISNNDFNYPSQSINIIANVEEGFGVSLGGDPNGASIGSSINTTLNTSTIQNTSGTDFGKIQTDIGIVTLAADNGAYEQQVQLKSSTIDILNSDKNTNEQNFLRIQTNTTYSDKYIETGEGFVGNYLEAPSITGSLLGTASFAQNATTSSYPISVEYDTLYSTNPPAGTPYFDVIQERPSNANSIFLGNQAGFSASGADGSNFLGTSAGAYTTASNSNFLGPQAGQNATNANDSNFLGSNAGRYASGASNSNFLGNSAGYQATNAGSSNFLGPQAGQEATNANDSNFLGSGVGYQATNASNSNFLGSGVGEGATNASLSNFLGQNSGYQATNANNSNFLGQNSGYQATNANNSNFLGNSAGRTAVSASYSTLIGYNVGNNGSGTRTINTNNIIIGTNISLPSQSRHCINLGGLIFATGSYSTTTGNAFSSSVANGRVGINTFNPQYNLHVSGSIFASTFISSSFTGSLLGTASYALNGLSASFAVSASRATTASYALTSSYNVNPTVSGSINNVDYIDFNTSYTATQPVAGRLSWNDTDGTLDIGLKGSNVTLQIGQEEVARVVNKTGGNLLEADYRVVRIRSVAEGGAQGGRLAVVLAQGDNDDNSATTLGVVTENIDVNQEGFITLSGQVRKINTTGALQGETWVDGDVLYLSSTTPGYLTNIKPQAPQHTVIIGFVEYAHANNGKIFVKIDNGYEIDELHNVLINTGSLTTGQLLVRSGSVWINTRQLSGLYGLTGSLQATSLTGSLFGTGSISLFKDILSTGSINYTLQQQDTGRILHFTSSTATTVTIPPNLQIGSRFEGKQLGTGQLSFVTGSGVTIRTAATENAKTAEQYSVFAIDWIGAEEYMLYGRLEQA